VKPRYVVRPCDNCGSVAGLVRDRTWNVYDAKTDTNGSDRTRREDARTEAARLNAEPEETSP